MTDHINFRDFSYIVNDVFNKVFVENETGETIYEAETQDFYTRLAIVNFFEICNLTLTADKVDNDFDNIYKKIYSKEINDFIESNKQVQAIIKAIENKINHKLRMMENVHASNTDLAITSLIDAITEKVNNIDSSMFNKKNMSLIVDLANKLKEVDITDTKKVLNIISDNGKKYTKPKEKYVGEV